MINVVEDITKILKDDNLYDVEINISPSNVIVNLSCKDYDGKIPIKFDSDEYEIYIPKEKLTRIIGIGDIDIIKNIMDYLSEKSCYTISSCMCRLYRSRCR